MPHTNIQELTDTVERIIADQYQQAMRDQLNYGVTFPPTPVVSEILTLNEKIALAEIAYREVAIRYPINSDKKDVAYLWGYWRGLEGTPCIEKGLGISNEDIWIMGWNDGQGDRKSYDQDLSTS